MSILEKNILLSKKEPNGDRTLLYPITKAECVDGLEDFTPTIGENKNWFIGEQDTGVRAEGQSGVYVGSGEVPKNCDVQIDPSCEFTMPVMTVNGIAPDSSGNIELATGGIGSSCGTWEKIGGVTTTEEVSTVYVSVGEEYKEIFIVGGAKITDGSSTNHWLDINGTLKLFDNTWFYSNNYRWIMAHLILNDGFVFGWCSPTTVNGTNNFRGSAQMTARSKDITGGFGGVKMSLSNGAFQAGATLTVWGCK